MTLRKLAAILASVTALMGVQWGVASAATVPPGTPPGASVEMRNTLGNPQWYVLHAADPFTGADGNVPLGGTIISHVRWTHVTPTVVNGTGYSNFDDQGLCVNGPVSIALHGSGYRYTVISVTLLQYWISNVHGGACPPDGHGQVHNTSHTHLAVNDPTLNLMRV